MNKFFKKFKNQDSSFEIIFKRKKQCPACGSNAFAAKPAYSNCSTVIRINCDKCGLGWSEITEQFIKTKPKY